MLWYDIMIRAHETVNGKQVVVTRRVPLPYLNGCVRGVQNSGNYVVGVIPIFKKREPRPEGLTEVDLLPNDFDDEDIRG